MSDNSMYFPIYFTDTVPKLAEEAVLVESEEMPPDAIKVEGYSILIVIV